MGSCASVSATSNAVASAEVTFNCDIMTNDGDLFDFENKTPKTHQKITATQPGFLVRHEGKVAYYQKQNFKKAPLDAQVLLEIRFGPEKLTFHHATHLEKEDLLDPVVTIKKAPWLCAIPLPQEKKSFMGRRLHEEDVIRFGRVQFIIKKLSPTGTLDKDDDVSVPTRSRRSTSKRRQTVTWETINTTGENTPGNTLATIPRHGEETSKYRGRVRVLERFSLTTDVPLDKNAETTAGNERVCRICLCEEDEQDDPIVTPCKCQGTMREVHVKCFKKWLTKHVTVRDSINMNSIVWDQLKCELCNTEVENFLEVDGKRYELIEFPKLPVPHLALEYYIGGKSKGFHILKYNDAKKAITFGRATDSDLRVNDSTVSRFHAAINLIEGKFYLQDLESKFGTLILVDEPEKLTEEQGNHFILEIARVLIECRVKEIKRRPRNQKTISTRSNSQQQDTKAEGKHKESLQQQSQQEGSNKLTIPISKEEQSLSATQDIQNQPQNEDQIATIERSIHTISVRNQPATHRTLVDSPFRRIYEVNKSQNQEQTIEPKNGSTQVEVEERNQINRQCYGEEIEEEKKIDREEQDEKYLNIEPRMGFDREKSASSLKQAHQDNVSQKLGNDHTEEHKKDLTEDSVGR